MASDDNYALPPEADEPRPDALAFVNDHAAMIRRFLLAELLAPPVTQRRRAPRHAATSRPKDPGDRGAV